MSVHANAVRLDLMDDQMAALCGAVGLAAWLDGNAQAGVREPHSAAFSALQSMERVNGHELILTSPALLGLMRLGASDKGRMQRVDLVGQSSGMQWKLGSDDVRLLLGLGYVMERSRWIEITDLGNELVRALLVFARGWKGGSARS